MTAQILAFPRKTEAKASDRAADEHMLLALHNRDRLMGSGDVSKLYVDFRCVFSGMDGLAEYLRHEIPTMTNAGIGEYLSTALSHYRTQVLGLVE